MKSKLIGILLMVFMLIPSVAFAETATISRPAEKEHFEVPTADIGDNDELLQQYIEQGTKKQAKRPMLKASRQSARNGLTNNEKALYDALKVQIEKVAAGETESTILSVPLAAVVNGVEQKGSSWTVSKEVLGVDYLFNRDENGNIALDSDGHPSLTSEADDAWANLYAYDGRKVVNALMLDLPYDFYWFDKTTTGGYGYTLNATTYFNDNEVFFNEEPKYVFTFRVAKAYSKTNEYKTTNVDTSKTAATANTVSKVNEIVAKYADKSDIEKINGYKEEICNLASYGAENNDYGDPWQIIYVFDENPNTEVVCEGYAKAFQFLCDKTTFSNPDIRCYTVSGDLKTAAAGTQGHMWNIIKMDDGKNYLVDLTNCEQPFSGYPDKVFLKGAKEGDVAGGYTFNGINDSLMLYTYSDTSKGLYSEEDLTLSAADYQSGEPAHTHNAVLVSAKEATCTEPGNREYYYCEECKTYFADKDCQTVLEEKDIAIKELGHDYQDVPDSAVAATCTQAGHKANQECTRCHNVINGEEIPATGEHTWGEWVVTTEPTETAAGTKERTCSVCGEKETESIEALQHTHVSGEPVHENEKAATCTEKGSYDEVVRCTGCNEIISSKTVETEALGHKWGDWTTVKAATATEDGEQKRTCERCYAEETKVIPKVEEHTHVAGPIHIENEVKPTCTSKGTSDVVIYCTICGEEMERKPTETDMLPHTWGEWIPDGEGSETRTCSVCGKTETRPASVGPLLCNHEQKDDPVKENVVDATCTNGGSYDEVVYCKNCKEEVSREHKTTEALGHKWGEWTTTKEATATEDGEQKRTCERCNESETKVIPKTPAAHTHSGKAPVKENEKAADCTKAGSYDEVVYCECGEEMSRKTVTVDALGHNFGEWKVTKEATETAKGEKVRECSRCHEKETAEIPAKTHTHNIVKVNGTPATETTDGTKEHFECSVCHEKFADANGKTPVKDSELVIPKTAISYELTEGLGQTWKPEDEPLKFRFVRSTKDEETMNHFKGIEIDGKATDKFDKAKGSVIVTLKKELLETLSEGNHTLTAKFDDGEASTSFTVAKSGATPTDGTTPAGGTTDGSETKPSSEVKPADTTSDTTVSEKTSDTQKDEISEDDEEEEKDEAESKSGSKAPKTGDSTMVYVWVIALIGAALSLAFIRKVVKK